MINTFIIPVLRSDYIERCIETLYRYTPNNFKVIVIDQTKSGLPDIKGVHLKIRPYRNLGFSKALNEGIIHALHWKSDFITCWNDDVECINKAWWNGIMDTFNMESGNEILVVNPESAKIPLWGYGAKGYVEVIDYKKEFTDEDYKLLVGGDFTHLKTKYPNLPKTFPLNYQGVCDGFAAFGAVFKRKHFELIGLWDERYYPGGGEDYDMMTRVYRKKYRAVSTRSSWVWHHWGKSKDSEKEAQETSMPIEDSRRWADVTYLWPPSWNGGKTMDVWGFWDNNGVRTPYKRREEIGIVDI